MQEAPDSYIALEQRKAMIMQIIFYTAPFGFFSQFSQRRQRRAPRKAGVVSATFPLLFR